MPRSRSWAVHSLTPETAISSPRPSLRAPRRILVKLSGEALGGARGIGIDPSVLSRTAVGIAASAEAGLEIALVVGGGNLCRGAALADAGIDRVTGDQMGMLATVMNALALRDALAAAGADAELLAAHAIASVADAYSARRARALLAAGTVLLLAGGTGNPLFTTDTAACLRAIEVEADLAVKATKVDGVYSADPLVHADAERFDALTYREAIDRRLRVMDLTAMALCEEHALPLVVCNIDEPHALTRIASGANVGTLVHASAHPHPRTSTTSTQETSGD